MVSFTEAQILAWVSAWIWPFFRILGLFTTAPVLSMRMVPRRVRIGLAALVVIAAEPSLPAAPAIALNSPEALMVMIQQVLIGLTMGFAARVVFAAIEFAGELVGLQMGLNFAGFFDPATGGQTTAVSRFFGVTVSWLFIVTGGHLAVIAALVSLVSGLWLQPWSARQIRETSFDIKTDVASTLVQPGQFTEPGPGLTVYAQSIDRDNKIQNLFIHQEMPSGGASTYSSREAEIATRRGEPVLIMRHGSNQQFSRQGVLQYTSFDEYTFDLSSLSHTDELLHYKIADRYPHELFFPDLTQDWEQRNKGKLLAEGHSRFASPLYNIALMTMALAAVLGGSFSRMGYGKRMAAVGDLPAPPAPPRPTG